MKNKILFSSLLLIASLILSSIQVWAQDLPPGEAIPTGPSEADIANYQQEFGVNLQDVVPKDDIIKPVFEEPQTVPDEVKQYATDADMMPIYCNMAKYKTGPFFGALVAIDKIVVPGIEKVRALGITVDMPDMAAIKAGGQQRLDAVCNAATVAEADAKIRELDAWGQNEAATKLEALSATVEAEIIKKSESFQKLIQSEVDIIVAAEKPRMESELKTYAQSLADAKKTELENADPETINIAAVQAEVRALVEAKAATYVADLKKKIQDKIDQIMAGKKEEFQAAADYFKNISTKINAEITAQLPAYDQFKTAAFIARKDLILKIVDKNLVDGITQLQAAKAEIDEAKKDNPEIEGVDQIIADLQADRSSLAAKLETAAAAGDENGMQNPLIDFRTKWEAIRTDMAAKIASTVSVICNKALPQFSEGKNQIDQNLSKLVDLNNKCATDNSDQCLKVREFASRFNTIINKLTGLKTEMAMVENSCKEPDKVNRTVLLDLLKKIKADGQDAKIFGEALAAEKDKAIAESLAQVCGQALPQIEAAKTEMANNDVPALRNLIKYCRDDANPDQEKCLQVGLYQADYESFGALYDNFIASANNAARLCKEAKEESEFEALRANLNDVKLSGQNLQEMGKELRAHMAEKDSEKLYCRITMGHIDGIQQKITDALSKIRTSRTECTSKTDSRCSKVISLMAKLNELENKILNTQGRINNIRINCNNNNIMTKPNDGLVNDVKNVRQDEIDIKAMLEKLMAEADSVGAGIFIDAEATYDYNKRVGVSNPFTKEIGLAGRPAAYGSGDLYMGGAGDAANYEFKVAKDGKYNVWVRDLATDNQGQWGRNFSLTIAGKNLGTFPENSSGRSAKYPPGAFAWHKVGQISLSAGQNKMRITKVGTTEGAAVIDAVYMTTDEDVPAER